MASNYHFNGGPGTPSGDGYEFDKPINHINIFVDTGVTFSISFDNGNTFLEVSPGTISMRIGPVNNVVVISDGAWGLVGVQA